MANVSPPSASFIKDTKFNRFCWLIVRIWAVVWLTTIALGLLGGLLSGMAAL